MKFIMILLSVLSLSLQAEELTEREKLSINKYLAERASTLEAVEYAGGREFLSGSLSKKNEKILAMLYTLEGFKKGNNYYFFLVVFSRTESGLAFLSDSLVGGKGSRTLSFKSMGNSLIEFTSKFSLPGDPQCCPTGEGTAIFYVNSRGKLRELNVSPKMP
ncbi:hypothetical protein [Glaciecola sp. 1036]|uniref:hypothetical protein n=1 Tax=Alteromonadaceae TaxID=72275 RepID=UPI003D020FFE